MEGGCGKGKSNTLLALMVKKGVACILNERNSVDIFLTCESVQRLWPIFQYSDP